MMVPADGTVASLKVWFDEKGKPFLAQHDLDKALELDQDLERLLKIDRRASEVLPVCFLGASGVGKSTLINALVAGHDNVLPSGGIGPLTALAMEVRYGEEARFEAEYQPPQNLWRLVFGLEQTFKRRQAAQPVQPPEDNETALELDEGVADEVADLQLDEGEPADNRFDRLRRQALKLVTDDQHGEVPIPYLLDRLRELCGRKPIWGTAPRPADTSRLQRLVNVLAVAKEGRPLRMLGERRPRRFSV